MRQVFASGMDGHAIMAALLDNCFCFWALVVILSYATLTAQHMYGPYDIKFL